MRRSARQNAGRLRITEAGATKSLNKWGSDVDGFVKGKRSKGSSSKGADLCGHCGKKGHWAQDCRGPGGRAEKRMEGDGSKRSSNGKGDAKKSARNCRYRHGTEMCWATSSTKLKEKGHGSKGKKCKKVTISR